MITIGTDCSGIEAPIEALKQLGIPFQHKWSCEIDKFARKSILANYEPEILYDDITKRDHSQLPDVDIYVCGFPCQSFSLMGKKRGTQDPRSNIMLHCIDVIKTKQPPVFILENVKNFKFIQKGQPYQFLLDSLSTIVDEDDKEVYNVYPDIYNTKDYGIPQQRERIFFIGIQKDICTQVFVKPSPLPIKPLDDFLIDKTICHFSNGSKIIETKLQNIDLDISIITPFLFCTPSKSNICPTLTTSCYRYFVTKYKRNLNVSECLLLQGYTQNFKQVVSKTQLCKQIGNTMSVNVLKEIFNSIFLSTLLHEIF